MDMDAESPACQIGCLQPMSESLGSVEAAWQVPHRLKRMARRRLSYFGHLWAELRGDQIAVPLPVRIAEDAQFRPGETVQVRSADEIRATLDRWNRLRGCTFVAEMWAYCGTTQRVRNRVELFLDERDYRVKRCRGIVLLEDVICQGSADFGRCDRSCFYFWREEWLAESR